jgi:cytochrome P450
MEFVMSKSFDLQNPRLMENPLPALAEFRARCPVAKISETGAARELYLVTSYNLVNTVLKDGETYSCKYLDVFTHGGGIWPADPAAEAIYESGWPEVPVLVVTDGDEHQRHRRIVARALTLARIKELEPKIEQATDELINRFVEQGRCDFIREFAALLPLYMIADIVGIDRAMMPKIAEWSVAFVLRNGHSAEASRVEIAKSIVEFQHYFFDQIQERRSNPRNDLLSDLSSQQTIDGLTPLTDVEILSILGLVVTGGNETTRSAITALIANSLLTEGQMDVLLADPSALNNAIDESLRFQAPAAATFRVATKHTQLGAETIPAGALLMLRLDSANRDEKVFTDPDRFDVRRARANRHLDFGAGAHVCVGMNLARREMTIAIPKLLRRLKNMRLDLSKCDFRNAPSAHTHALREVHLIFDPGTKVTASPR